jgi:23S rRNA (cytosine1962-C5)-methyltransferase
MGITRVYDKSHEALPADYASRQADGWRVGEGKTTLLIHEGGIGFDVDIAGGQKTGFFLDQRENRAMVGRYASGKTALNCFAYTGGFSLYALAAGATHVTSIDASAPAMAILDNNVVRQGTAEQHTGLRDDVLKFLTRSEDMYDLIVVDPPAFAKSLAKRHNAVQAYKRLNAMAMKRIKPGGMLFTFSCSQVVDKPLFHNTIVAAAIEAGRMARVMHDLGQGPDHPVSIHHPEGHYLKGLALYLD